MESASIPFLCAARPISQVNKALRLSPSSTKSSITRRLFRWNRWDSWRTSASPGHMLLMETPPNHAPNIRTSLLSGKMLTQIFPFSEKPRQNTQSSNNRHTETMRRVQGPRWPKFSRSSIKKDVNKSSPSTGGREDFGLEIQPTDCKCPSFALEGFGSGLFVPPVGFIYRR